MHETPERTRYHRSGRVAWFRFLPAAVVALALAGFMAWVLFCAFDAGWYYRIAAPALVAVPVAIAVYAAVALGHCRNVWVAGSFALMAALMVYLGYFHAHRVALAGPDALYRVDALPRFIAFRMASDVAVADAGQARVPNPLSNWISFGVDFLVVWAFLAVTAVLRSYRAYCEECRRWLRRLTAVAPPGTGRRIAGALKTEHLETLGPVPQHALRVGQPCTMIDLEYCPSCGGRGTSGGVFLTVKENPGAGFGRQGIDVLLNQVELFAQEIESLTDRLPALRAAILSPPGGDAEEPPSTPLTAPRSGAVGEIYRLPPESAREISIRMKALAITLSLVPVAALLGGAALLVVGVLQAPWAVGLAQGLFGWLLLSTGVAAVLFGAVVCWTNVDYFNFRYCIRVTRNTIQSRRDAIVMGDDPEAVYVNIVPRAHWSEMLPDRASDSGLMLVDLARRHLLFEGMKERYRIPAESLLSCEVEPINAATESLAIYVTVITVHYPEGGTASLSGGHHADTWELALLPRPQEFPKYNGTSRLALATMLCRHIHALLPADAR